MAVLTTSFNIVVKTYEQKWDDVISNIRSGGGITVGDTFPLKLSDGTIVNFMLVDITGNDYTFGAYPWLPRKTPDTESQSFLNSNKGSKTGWIESDLRTYLNNTWFGMLPSNIKNAIKPKTSTYRQDVYDTARVSASDNIWVPSIENLTDFSSGKLQKPFSSYVAGPDKPLQYYFQNETRTTSRVSNTASTTQNGYYTTETQYSNYNNNVYIMAYNVSGKYYNFVSAVATYKQNIIPNFIISK